MLGPHRSVGRAARNVVGTISDATRLFVFLKWFVVNLKIKNQMVLRPGAARHRTICEVNAKTLQVPEMMTRGCSVSCKVNSVYSVLVPT